VRRAITKGTIAVELGSGLFPKSVISGVAMGVIVVCTAGAVVNFVRVTLTPSLIANIDTLSEQTQQNR
jgi:hypothetical protein